MKEVLPIEPKEESPYDKELAKIMTNFKEPQRGLRIKLLAKQYKDNVMDKKTITKARLKMEIFDANDTLNKLVKPMFDRYRAFITKEDMESMMGILSNTAAKIGFDKCRIKTWDEAEALPDE